MRKEKILEESKNYLISVHDTLRRAFRSASEEESIYINDVLKGIEANVKQLETLEEIALAQNRKEKDLEIIEE